MQFFMHNGRWVNREQMKKIAEKEALKRTIFCDICGTKSAITHKKGCPLRKDKRENPENDNSTLIINNGTSK